MSIKKIAVIIPWSINNDSRARRTIKEMSIYSSIDVFYIPKNEEDKSINGVYSENVEFFPLRKPIQSIYNKIIQNSFFYLRYSYFIDYILLNKIKYDILYIHDLISGHIGVSLKKKLNCKLVYDVHDLYVETLNQEFPINKNGLMSLKHTLLYKTMLILGKKYEHKVINKSDLIYTVNQSCADYLKQEYHREDILYFRNFPEYRERPISNNYITKETTNKENKSIAVYIGSIAKGRNLKNIVKSANFLDKDNIIVIVGDGVLKQDLIELAKENNTFSSKIFFLKSMPYDVLFENITEAKIGFMLLDPINKSKEYALANKISEYMLCGIIPLLSDHVEHQKLDCNTEFSFRINKYEPINIANKINEIFKDNTLLNKKSVLARKKFEEKYNWEIERKEFILPFKKLLSK